MRAVALAVSIAHQHAAGDSGGMGIGDTVSAVLRHRAFWDKPQRAAHEVWIARNKNAAANGYTLPLRTNYWLCSSPVLCCGVA